MRGTIAAGFRKMAALPPEERGDDKYFDGYPLSNMYPVQERGWMSSELMMDWAERIWKPWVDSRNGPTLLILDKFGGHCTEEVKAKISSYGTVIHFIPGDLTNLLKM